MSKLLDAFWRAAMYCLHPRVIALSVLPLIIMGAISLGLGYFFWDDALAAIRSHLGTYELVNTMVHWLEAHGSGRPASGAGTRASSLHGDSGDRDHRLAFVAILMTPAMVALVAERRFPQLERKQGGSMVASLFWSLGSTSAGSGRAHRVNSAVADPAADFGAAAFDLGLAHATVSCHMTRWLTMPAAKSGARFSRNTVHRCSPSASSAATWAPRPA